MPKILPARYCVLTGSELHQRQGTKGGLFRMFSSLEITVTVPRPGRASNSRTAAKIVISRVFSHKSSNR